MFLTNLLELSRRSVDPWVEENIVTMLQLGAIKKIHRDFFFRVLILARMERGKDYGKRFILDLKTMIQISHQKILKNQRTKVSSWSLKIVYTKRHESYWKPSCVYIVQISVQKDAPYIQANAAMRRLIQQTQSGETKPCRPGLITEGSQAGPGVRFIITLHNLVDNRHLPLYKLVLFLRYLQTQLVWRPR